MSEEGKNIVETVIEEAPVIEQAVIEEQPAVEEEISITLDDENEVKDDDDIPDEENDEPNAPSWVKQTRARNKELNHAVKELKRQLDEIKAASIPAQAPEPTLPEKPTLDDCGYDVDLFEEQLLKWNEAKSSVIQKQRAAQEEEEKLQSSFKAKVEAFNQRKASLKVSDFDAAEASVKAAFDPIKQGILVDVADDPTTLVYALYKNPSRLKELSDIKNPLQFAKAITLLETKIKVQTKSIKPKVTTDTPVKGTSGVQNDARLSALTEEANKTGDRTKVIQYKREMNRK
jgi:hypothetical protein